MIFDEFANVVVSSQREFPQYYPHPGYVSSFSMMCSGCDAAFCRWHDHDAAEIMSTAEICIEEACVELEKLGFPKESIKVIGTPPSILFKSLELHMQTCQVLQISVKRV